MAVHLQSSTSPASLRFPDRPQFSGFMKPCRFEGEIQNLEVEGKIPPEIDGTFYRVMPDPQFAPFIEDDPWFNGDGNISAFRIKSGRVHFKQRYIRTEKFTKERQAQRALLGKYRNKYTDAIEFQVRTTANTNVVAFNGKLLALKEDARPYALNPKTLETLGIHDFDGQLPSVTFTAHPKFDPKTGEMLCFGYEAKGDGTPDVCYYSVNPDGKFTEIVWMICPVVAMIHDFAVTSNWVLFPVIPQTCDIERMKQGGEHWQWNPDIPFYIGLLPRRGAKGSEVRWLRAPNAFPGHVANAFETPEGNIHIDLSVSDKNVFFWWPDAQGNAPDPREIKSTFRRFTINPQAASLDLSPPQELQSDDSEFYRIDDRYATQPYRHCFFNVMDQKLPTDFPYVFSVFGGGHPPYNALGHLDLDTRKCEKYFPGSTHFVQEPVFLPRSDNAMEGEGYLMALVNNYKTMSSELHIIDTRNFNKAQAIVRLPLRLRHGLHGNWVAAQDIELNNS